MTTSYKTRKGENSYVNYKRCDLPHSITPQKIIDERDCFVKIEDPHDIHSYKIGKYYYLNYQKFRVEDINIDHNMLVVRTALEKGKMKNIAHVNINNLEHVYLIDTKENYENKLSRKERNKVRNLSKDILLRGSKTQKQTLGLPGISRYIETYMGGKKSRRNIHNSKRRRRRISKLNHKKTLRKH